ncbi:MAG: bifunctional glutamate N-acetyltransferase/amino-acid acetyltransferase ArgJ [Defluviitaleaceae bacterium]|nr:bifunctional glutamate N-acetyltransferase/amino-acid acetyltransferase ArgJ [Defluviitaleaceae bacterium]
MEWLEDVGVTAPRGFRAASTHAGIKKRKLDVGLIVADAPCSTAAVYTTSVVQAGCIHVTKAHLKNNVAQAVIVNSGNANACTPHAQRDALRMCQLTALALKIQPEEVAVASTGVIGVPLPIGKIEKAIPKLVSTLEMGLDADTDVATSIMTTDLIQKQVACQIQLAGKEVLIAGIAKGSGMIHPNMATMLSFITTDAAISPDLLQQALKEVTEPTFNSISVDGDTSTNDMNLIMASGQAGNKLIDKENDDYERFKTALQAVCLALAKKIATDGEGATKLMTCVVTGCQTEAEAKALSMSVNASSLVKTAMTGADANWGRILCAMGYAGVEFDPAAVEVMFQSKAGEITVCQDGVGVRFDETKATRILSEKEVTIAIQIKTPDATATWTTYGCNLTNEYVRINGEYRS